MIVLAIDPGSSRSAWLVYDSVTGVMRNHAIWSNDLLLEWLRGEPIVDLVVIEKIESYGMAIGAEVFDTVHWSGRFTEAVRPLPVVQLPRREVKLHLCGSTRAKDPNVRAALLDRFGGSAARGTKTHPGPLYGISGDLWAALAVAVTYADQVGVHEAWEAAGEGSPGEGPVTSPPTSP